MNIKLGDNMGCRIIVVIASLCVGAILIAYTIKYIQTIF